MKKVCILQNGLAMGGTDTFVLNVCKGLDKTNFDIIVVNPSSKPGSRVREQDVKDTGAKIIHTTQLSSFKGKIKHLFQLYKVLRNNKIDIFQTNVDLFNGPNLFIAWLAKVPIRCCHSHNTNQQKALVSGESISVRSYQVIMRYLCWRFSNRRCGCSNAAMDFLFNGHNWKCDKYPQVIFNGIDLAKFKEPIDIKKKKEELGLINDKHLITIGHIIPQKNPLFIAELFSKFAQSNKDCDLVWVGDGFLKQKVCEILKKYNVENRVHFFANRTDIHEILKCCNAFLLPSSFEGLGIVAIEAQASGVPCILSTEVPKEVDCGLCQFVPLKNNMRYWINIIEKIMSGNHSLEINDAKLSQYSIENMTIQMTKVFES